MQSCLTCQVVSIHIHLFVVMTYMFPSSDPGMIIFGTIIAEGNSPHLIVAIFEYIKSNFDSDVDHPALGSMEYES